MIHPFQKEKLFAELVNRSGVELGSVVAVMEPFQTLVPEADNFYLFRVTWQDVVCQVSGDNECHCLYS